MTTNPKREKPTPEEKCDNRLCRHAGKDPCNCNIFGGFKMPDKPPSPEARVDWEQQADDFCIWLTGGVSEFSLPRERVMAYWKIEFKKSLQAAFEKGREAR